MRRLVVSAFALVGCDGLFGTHFDGRHLRTEPPDDPPLEAREAGASAAVGDPDAGPASGTPDAASTESDLPVALVAAGYHNCALTRAGRVRCWGNYRSRDDDQPLWQTSRPEVVPLSASDVTVRARAVATGESHTCAITTLGGVRCWGRNTSGQLGDGTTTTSATPVSVKGLETGARALAVGLRHTCALMEAGNVQCWGDRKMLGSSAPGDASSPRPVESTFVAEWIAAGDFHTCAGARGEVFCWGFNANGPLGTGDRAYTHLPTAVAQALPPLARLVAGGETTLAIDEGGTLHWWGLDVGEPLESKLLPAVLTGDVLDAAVGFHGCVVTNARNAACWGVHNDVGVLGPQIPLESGSRQPSPVAGLADLTSVGVGAQHSCALDRAGVIHCWGANSAGQLGRGSLGRPDAAPQRVLW